MNNQQSHETGSHRDQPGIEPLPEQYGLGAAGQAALATGVAFLSAAYPPAAIPLAGAGAGLQAVGERLNTIQRARTAEFLAAASRESSCSPEEVVQALLERDDLVLLAADAIDAARRSRLQDKASVLGESLGAILADKALFDLESVWVRVVSVVEPSHIRILGRFLEHTGTMGTGSTLWGRGPMLKVSQLGESLGLDHAVLPLVQDLIRAGLVMEAARDGMAFGTPDAYGQLLVATDLGAQLFARLSVAGLTDSN